MTTENKEKLERVMRQFKEILIKEDVVASITLALPEVSEIGEKIDFGISALKGASIQYCHTDTSFSCVKKLNDDFGLVRLSSDGTKEGAEETMVKLLKTMQVMASLQKGTEAHSKRLHGIITGVTQTLKHELASKKQKDEARKVSLN